MLLIRFILIFLSLLCYLSCSCKNTEKLYFYDNKDAGKLLVKLSIEDDGKEIKIYTQKHRLSKFLPFPKAALARIFSKNMFFEGSLLTLKANWKGDTAFGYAYSVFGLYKLKVTKLKNENYKCLLLNAKDEVSQEIFPADHLILPNYNKIIDSAENITRDYFYDFNTNQTQLKNYFNKLRSKSDIYSDDLEFVAYSFIEKQKLPFSHFGIFKLQDNFTCSADNPTQESKAIDSNTFYLKVDNFTAASKHYENAINFIQKNKYKNLIIDLRDNTGGFFQPAYLLASFLVPYELSGGYFLSNHWYKNNSKAPTSKDISSFKKIDHTVKTLDEFLNILSNESGCELKFYTNTNAFKGNIYILTNQNTASTSEPFVYGVGKLPNTTIIGERTAGSMLSSARFSLPSDFVISVPTANYFTSDGFKIDKIGIIPDIESQSENALIKCLRIIKNKN
jgi:hypothetical protein